MQKGFTLKRGKVTVLQSDTPNKRQHLSPGYSFRIGLSPGSSTKFPMDTLLSQQTAGERPRHAFCIGLHGVAAVPLRRVLHEAISSKCE